MGWMDKNQCVMTFPKYTMVGTLPTWGDGLGYHLIHAPLFEGMPITLQAFNPAKK
jgi:hypothetical protein